jgi:hypothetical protein
MPSQSLTEGIANTFVNPQKAHGEVGQRSKNDVSVVPGRARSGAAVLVINGCKSCVWVCIFHQDPDRVAHKRRRPRRFDFDFCFERTRNELIHA